MKIAVHDHENKYIRASSFPERGNFGDGKTYKKGKRESIL